MNDDKRLERLYLRERAALTRLVAKKVGDRTLAEDIAQDSFVRLLNSDAPERLHDPKAFLFRIALNLAVDNLRYQSRRRLVDIGDEGTEHASEIQRRQSADPAADRVLESKERLGILLSAIKDMPEKDRHAFMRHRFGDRSYAEIAEEMQVSKSMVEKHIASALAYCRARLKDKGY